jgi:hypothetical protein
LPSRLGYNIKAKAYANNILVISGDTNAQWSVRTLPRRLADGLGCHGQCERLRAEEHRCDQGGIPVEVPSPFAPAKKVAR